MKALLIVEISQNGGKMSGVREMRDDYWNPCDRCQSGAGACHCLIDKTKLLRYKADINLD